MKIDYVIFQDMPDNERLTSLLALHLRIFGREDDLVRRMAEKRKLLFVLALRNDEVIGYKIGYELNREQFYSWLGGVNPVYRKLGIATELMKRQHQFVEANAYHAIQTKTKNQCRDMLILNIKMGFNIIGTYTNQVGDIKIILEKKF